MTVIPELLVRDVAAARRMLCGTFGFADAGPGRLSCHDQTIALAEGNPAGHGAIDHLALSVPDLDAAAEAALARGARRDPAVTPDGPRAIAEFWGGVRFVFLQGPEGARIELIERPAAPRGPGLDHIGLPVPDIAAATAFAEGLGARLAASVRLSRPEGITEVRFLTLGAAMLELYQPPFPSAPATPGLWHRLLIPGIRPQTGPGGLVVAPP
ncbi:VOC family protein [Rhodobacter sp. Har01]|uniref:VOC family protein n=1 Tax=Rhodobacter sp. Har01 TaxID=2883999 RepID=UPI001D065452|nr:VOC family protein [Rhodobacter sp. Har01]MCB6177708.1 VOC family protein [Rhodobacter sp. Har01]